MTRESALRRTSRVGALLCSATLLCGCATTTSDDEPQAPQPQARQADTTAGRIGVVSQFDGVRIVHDDWAELGYRWEWSNTPVTVGKGEVQLVDVLDEYIAVQSEDSWTALLRANTGRRLWQVRNVSSRTRFVDNFRSGDTLVSVARPGLALMEITSGNLLARQPAAVVISTPPVVFGGLAVFGTPTGEVLCHRFGTASGDPLPPPFEEGRKEWSYLIEGAIEAAPVRIGEIAGLVSQTGMVFFVEIPTGRGVGRSQISGGMATDPVTDGALMYVSSLDQSIYAFAPSGGAWLWRYRTAVPLTAQPTVSGGRLYQYVPGEGLLAFDTSEDARREGRLGEKVWVSPDVRGEVVAIRSDELVVWDGEQAWLVDRELGDVLVRVALPDVERLITSELVDGDIYALHDTGLISKFSPR